MGTTRIRTAILTTALAGLLAAGCGAVSHDLDPGDPGLPVERATPTVPAAPAASGPPGPRMSEGPAPPAVEGSAAELMATLPVKGRAPKTGYDRDRFGQRWADVDRNGCDQRNDVLARDLDELTFRDGTRDCVVLTGVLADPYTGETIDFTRGQDTSADVHIDHVVALSDAWQKGAQQLDPDTRERFANDPLNLVAVGGPINAAKGDGDAATWLPPDRSVRCAFVARQVAVKARYDLWVTAAERDAVARILQRCPGEPIPGDGPLSPASGTGAP